MSAEAMSRQIRLSLIGLFALSLGATLLFGRVPLGAGMSAGFRQRVIMIYQSANGAMADLGISDPWRAVAWLSALISIAATFGVIWLAMKPEHDGE